jgi:hypothetical protein
MITYPSIPKKITDISYYLFDKIDGSNIRAEFSLKKGFHRFGSRHRLLSDESGPILNKSKDIILAYEDIVKNIFRKQRWEAGTLFFEFYGEHSFAGNHSENDDFKVVLIDFHLERKGFLHPKDFLDTFDGNLPTPNFLGISKLSDPLIRKIQKRDVEGMGFEGIVAKAVVKNQVVRCKVKTFDWLNKLKNICGEDENLFNKLA